jgi:hypothetical protein
MDYSPPYDPSIDYAALDYGPDMPGQNVMQGVPQAGPTDLLSQIQPQAADPNAPQAAPADPNAAQPTNILQQAAAQPQAGQPGQYVPSQQLGQPGQYVPAPVSPPRQRGSFLDMLGALSDRINRGMGAPTTSQLAQAHAQNLEAADLNNQAKLQDIAQTGVATQQNANQLVNTFANGLKSIKAAGGNLTASAPVLAQQLGIPMQQAQAILAQEQQTPGFVDNLAASTESAAGKAAAAAKFANQPLYAKDAQGNLHVFQLSNAGGIQEAKLPDGMAVAPGVKYEDTGTSLIPTSIKTGQPVGPAIAKSGAPESGTVADGKGGYAPLPGSLHQANIEKTKAETDKVAAANQATAEKARTTATADVQKQRAVQDNLKSLEAGIYKLRDLGALNSTSVNPVGNVVNAIQATGIGQAISHVTNPQVAAARDQIKAAANGILLNMSSGRSQMFRTNAEQTRALQAINNPQSSLPVMLQALKAFKDAATPVAPAAPAGKVTAPKGTWGKAQVVQ